ncbi:MAG: EF-hand domain-containing protein [Verrucomicrobia bacterium]|nr:EF-hand domain-containing protein [Verrucomicrobiota bacterium]MDA1068434.1 EF-hand domain-containing protein [Verrucomicrobiota bacterium]
MRKSPIHICLVALVLFSTNFSAQQIAERFNQWDKNNDGRLTKDEVPEQARTRMDTNGDGEVTREEMDAFLTQRSGSRPNTERRAETNERRERPSSESRVETSQQTKRPALNLQQRQQFASLVKSIEQVDTSQVDDAWNDSERIQKTSEEAVDYRKRVLIHSGAEEFQPKGGPKHTNPLILCRLLLDPTDKEALAYLPVGIPERSNGDHFGKSSLSRIWCQFGSLLSPQVKADLLADVTAYENFFGGGTENHIAMRRTTGYLFGESFPDAIFHGGKTGREIVAEATDYMRTYGRAVYAHSMSEFLSTTYQSVNTAPWLNVVDFSKDDSARLMARAILDWMLVDLALNYNHGILTPPAVRENGFIEDHYQLAYPRTQTSWTAWLYFGGGLIPGIDKNTDAAFSDTKYKPLQPYGMAGILHAVSPFVPDPVIRNLGTKRLKTPFMTWQSRAASASELVRPGSANDSKSTFDPRLRSTYTHKNYSMGTGYFGEHVSMSLALAFAVSYKSKDEHNYVLAQHPYWYTDAIKGQEPEADRGQQRGQGTSRPQFDLDEDWMGVSPFCQSVHWENAVVQLYDIPTKDPYTNADWKTGGHMQSARLSNPVQSVFLYVPEAIDERIQLGNVFFFREGEGENEVYIAVRPLRAGATWTQTLKKGYVRLELPAEANLTGFALEMGDRAEFGSFQEFQKRITDCELDTSRLDDHKEVTYTSTRGDKLHIQHQSVPNRYNDWLPNSSINGATLDFAEWPICESPYVKSRDRVLDVNDGHAGFTIDWSGDLPEYSYYNLVNGTPVITRKEFIKAGKLVISPGS